MKITLNNINVEEVEVKGFEPLPEGEYRVRCTKEPELKEKNVQYLAWQFEVVNHPEYEGNRVTHNTPLSKDSVEMGTLDGIVAVLEALDIPYEITSTGTTFDTALATGQEAVVEVSQRADEEDEDKIYNDIDAIYPPE